MHKFYSLLYKDSEDPEDHQSKAEKLHKLLVNEVRYKNLQGMSLIIT